MAPKFIFVRHGEAEHNVAFHEQGESAFSDEKYADARLTEKGKEQAQNAGMELSSLKILDLWSSPLTRCIETSVELFEELNIYQMYLHDNLLERQGGDHICNKRKNKSEIKENLFLFDTAFLPETPPVWIERENQTSLHHRMFMFLLNLSEIYKKYSEDYHIVIVGHADALSSITQKYLKNGEYVIMSMDELRALKATD